jgi:predicted metal-dependent hydrolase
LEIGDTAGLETCATVNEAKPARREMLLVNGREIPVAVVRSRRARRYVLRLRDDGLARLTIPRNGSAKEGWEFAQRQRPWLERQLQYLASRPVRPKEWFLGTEILFRGERVKIETNSYSQFTVDHPVDSANGHSKLPSDDSLFAWASTAATQSVQPSVLNSNNPQSPGSIRIGSELIPVGDPTADLRPAIEQHLRTLAAKELPARTLEFAALHHLSVSRVTVRAQRSRWGSCSFKAVISLNWRLIQTPPFVCDYIILHELMHLRQMNHSARFWREVERVCPDYRRAKMWLKENPGLLDR